MRQAKLALAAIALMLLTAAGPAAAMTMAARSDLSAGAGGPRMQTIHFVCKCNRAWPRRLYWQWDSRPIWDDPWTVLQPNFWGSPEPDLVPADVWARKWHPPWIRRWRWHHRRHWRHAK